MIIQSMDPIFCIGSNWALFHPNYKDRYQYPSLEWNRDLNGHSCVINRHSGLFLIQIMFTECDSSMYSSNISEYQQIQWKMIEFNHHFPLRTIYFFHLILCVINHQWINKPPMFPAALIHEDIAEAVPGDHPMKLQNLQILYIYIYYRTINNI